MKLTPKAQKTSKHTKEQGFRARVKSSILSSRRKKGRKNLITK